MSLWSGLRLVALARTLVRFWAVTWTPLIYSVAGLWQGDPVALDLHVWFLRMLQQLIDAVDVGWAIL